MLFSINKADGLFHFEMVGEIGHCYLPAEQVNSAM